MCITTCNQTLAMKNFKSQKSNPTENLAFWHSSSTKRFTVEEIRRSTLFHTSKNMESNLGGILLDWNATELRGLNGPGRENKVWGIRFKHFRYFAERVIWYLLTNSAVSPLPVDICHGSNIASSSEDSSLLRCYIFSSGNSYGRFGGASCHNLQGQAAQEDVPAQEYWVITSLRDDDGRKDDKIRLRNVTNRLPGLTAWRPKRLETSSTPLCEPQMQQEKLLWRRRLRVIVQICTCLKFRVLFMNENF